MTAQHALQRRAVVAALLAQRGDALVVTGLGSPTWDVCAAGDDPRNFYLWGGMGGAAMVGLGLALAQPQRRVLVVSGDGEMLMGTGSLATIGVQRPANLAVVVLDNEHYGETGMQATHTGAGVDLAAIAKASLFAEAETLRTESELRAYLPKVYQARGPLFAAIKVSTDAVPLTLPLRDGTHIKNRFREALLGPEAFR
jgi:thiamine pyrophosphate-dependent acetolactate synthase large subunit-like protein